MKAKIGDKIRGVLEKYPEVKQRRAQLKAIGYLSKHDKDIRVRWTPDHKGDIVAVTNLNMVVCLSPLKDYLYEPPVPVVGKELGSGVMLTFKDGKLHVAP